MQCIQTLTEHTSVVMSVLCWDQFLLSCSLDKTIKVCTILINCDFFAPIEFHTYLIFLVCAGVGCY